MSQYLNDLKIGDTIDVRGPTGRLQYLGRGQFSIKALRNAPPTIVKVKKVAMIAGNILKVHVKKGKLLLSVLEELKFLFRWNWHHSNASACQKCDEGSI